MQLQSIQQPNPEICAEESLYFHREGRSVRFDGYFNLFYIEKRKYYTALNSLSLSLCLRGYSAIRLMHDRTELYRSELAPGILKNYRFELPYAETEKGVFWFSLEEAEDVPEKTIYGCYEGESDVLREINIAADICTFRRESFVARNLRSVLGFLRTERPAPEAAGHLRVLVVDNGRTLGDNAEIRALLTELDGSRPEGAEGPVCTVIPNRNVGGTGGFTRGMMGAIRHRDAWGLTHVLLMDDDAVFDPEIYVRLYGFLATAKEEYRDITVGGALLREDYPYIQQACGEWYGNFRGYNDHPLYDLRTFENCTAEHVASPVDPHPGRTYSGWWCCCYSMEAVRPDNLPMPLFLHHDDITYGLKNRDRGLVFLNGVGGWHKGFGMTFAGTNQYYDIRNPLITASIFEPDTGALKTIKKIWFALTAMLIQYRYAEAWLTWRGLCDYLKGPRWLMNTDGEKLHGRLREYVGKHFPMAPLDRLDDSRYARVKAEIGEACDAFGWKEIEENERPRRLRTKLLQMLTLNGWLLPADPEILAVSATDSPFKGFRRKEIVLYEPLSRKAAAAKRDGRMLALFAKIYIKSAWLILTRYRRTAAAYRAAEKELTSQAMWERYLR